ncbi:MAG: DNA-binding response regulator [Phototrophicales bacterium]|nr:MAG: DNA-binding response regulator [Phototrophicales bacterium]
MDEIRIIIADDHTVLRAGLRMLLEAQEDIKVIGEADNASQALEIVGQLQPDLLLLDLSMPGLSGLEALPLILKRAPRTRVLILTMYDDENYLRQAIQYGAAGYVLKRAADAELILAIRAVMRGEIYIHPALTRQLLDNILPNTKASASDPWDTLSDREKEVLLLVARGYTSARIAAKLNLSSKTVDTYRSRGMEKLGLRSRAALVQYALTHHLLSNDL